MIWTRRLIGAVGFGDSCTTNLKERGCVEIRICEFLSNPELVYDAVFTSISEENAETLDWRTSRYWKIRFPFFFFWNLYVLDIAGIPFISVARPRHVEFIFLIFGDYTTPRVLITCSIIYVYLYTTL